jgi:uncharacterized lipoprotein YbaY/heat shock protein HslJ/uncharacterized lipoprotein NlpE involved in copper resistance
MLLTAPACLAVSACATGMAVLPVAGEVAGTWVREVKVGDGAIQEGLVLDPDGGFGLLGIHTMHGVSWRLDGETLVLATNTGRYPEPRESGLRVESLEKGSLRLSGQDYLSGEWRRDDGAAGRVSGTVTYRARVALPANAAIHLELQDVSRQDAAAAFVAGRAMATQGRQVPIPFRIYYRKADIEPRFTYALRATITADGERRFLTTRQYPVITRGAPSELELVLESADGGKSSGAEEAGRPGPPLELPATYRGIVACAGCPSRDLTLNLRSDGVFLFRESPAAGGGAAGTRHGLGRWSLAEGGRTLRLASGTEAPRVFAVLDSRRLRMLSGEGQPIDPGAGHDLERAPDYEPFSEAFLQRGLFQYYADAATFTDCESGKRLPVAMEKDYLAAERAYLAARVAPAAPLLVTLEGRWAQRPKMEGPGTQESLVIEKFARAWPGETCTPRGSDLTGTYWRLSYLEGARVAVQPGQREPHMVLRAAEGRVQGFAGCNGFFGGYEIRDGGIRFSRMGATMMACPEGMETQDAFLKALAAADRHEIVGEYLLLYQGDRLVARFEAVYLR